MGMFDFLELELPNPNLVCVRKHPITKFITKDLDCSMISYLLKENSLYSLVDADIDYKQEEHNLILCPTTRMVNVQGDCNICHETAVGLPNSSTFELFFINGILKHITLVRQDS